MTNGELTQLVIFRTTLTAEQFTATWRPVASGFLAEGLSTITLAAFGGSAPDGIAFVSRNTWPETAYRRTFPGGLAADGGGGAVAVAQAGVFSVDPRGGEPVAAARTDRDLGMALLTLADPAQIDAAATAMLASLTGPSRQVVVYRGAHDAQRYDVAVTVHGTPGSGAESAAALRAAAADCPAVAQAVVLSGRELLSLGS